MIKKTLFIGSCADGKWYEINPYRFCKIPKPIEYVHLGNGETPIEPDCNYEEYQFVETENRDFIMVQKDILPQNVIDLLIKNYNPVKETKEIPIENKYHLTVFESMIILLLGRIENFLAVSPELMLPTEEYTMRKIELLDSIEIVNNCLENENG